MEFNTYSGEGFLGFLLLTTFLLTCVILLWKKI